MEFINIKYNGNGNRKLTIRASGFMGPAKQPLDGRSPLKVAGEFLKSGDLTTAYQLEIPPSGLCQVVDCEHNRELLEKLTKPRIIWEEVSVFNNDKGAYEKEKKKITLPAPYSIIGEELNEEPKPEVVKTSIKKEKKVAKRKAKDDEVGIGSIPME